MYLGVCVYKYMYTHTHTHIYVYKDIQAHISLKMTQKPLKAGKISKQDEEIQSEGGITRLSIQSSNERTLKKLIYLEFWYIYFKIKNCQTKISLI